MQQSHIIRLRERHDEHFASEASYAVPSQLGHAVPENIFAVGNDPEKRRAMLKQYGATLRSRCDIVVDADNHAHYSETKYSNGASVETVNWVDGRLRNRILRLDMQGERFLSDEDRVVRVVHHYLSFDNEVAVWAVDYSDTPPPITDEIISTPIVSWQGFHQRIFTPDVVLRTDNVWSKKPRQKRLKAFNAAQVELLERGSGLDLDRIIADPFGMNRATYRGLAGLVAQVDETFRLARRGDIPRTLEFTI